MQRPEGGGGGIGRGQTRFCFFGHAAPSGRAGEGRVTVPGDVDGKLDKEQQYIADVFLYLQ